MSQLLEVKNLSKSFTIHHLNKSMQAIEEVSFSLEEGEFIGIVGKSGSGKSTVLKSIYRTYLPEKGEVMYNSENLDALICRSFPKEKCCIYASMKLVTFHSF